MTKKFETLIASLLSAIHNPILWFGLLILYGIIRVVISNKN